MQMPFSSQIEAKLFLINKITDQASRVAKPLSDPERRMLQVSVSDPESAIGIPVEMLKDPGQVYESKMAQLLQAAYSRDRNSPQEQRKYQEAVKALEQGDHYILIIAAAAIPRRKSTGSYAIYIIIALAVAAMIAMLQIWTHR